MSAAEMETLDFERIEALLSHDQESYYVLFPERFERNWHRFHRAFADIYANVRVAYSYKTNYTPLLCALVDRCRGYAEVVSGLEYELARRVGVDPRDVIFNGPYKGGPALERALLAGSVVNIDSVHELEAVERVARCAPDDELRVGVRCAVVPAGSSSTRFGFDVTRPEFVDALERLRRIPNVALAGLHCHAMPSDRSAAAYGDLAKRVVEVAVRNFTTDPPACINLGGGFYSPMSPHLQASLGIVPPSYEEYAAEIAGAMQAEWAGDASGPQLVLEPGMAVVADAQLFVCKVVDVKTIEDRNVAQVSGSVYNIRPTKSRRQQPFSVYPNADERALAINGPVDIVGYTCMEDDVLYHDYDGRLARGDRIVFENVGAYTLVLAPPFILPQAPVIAVSGGEVQIAREAGSFDEFFGSFRLAGAPLE
jgi:diaminopimelate decarboxylase